MPLFTILLHVGLIGGTSVPASPRTVTPRSSAAANADDLEATVRRACSEFCVLEGIIAQRRVRAKEQAPFACLGAGSLASLLDEYDTFVFDCDGVLWSGSLGLLPGAAAMLSELERRGKRCIFVTNNSARSREGYAKKFAALGLSVAAEQIVPASFVAARWLKRAKPGISAALVIGEEGVSEELRAAGIEAVRADAGTPFDEAAFASAMPDAQVGAVVVGADAAFSFAALAAASLYLEQADCLFVATNDDAYDVVGGRRLPGNGCLVAAVQTACGRPPDAVCGKPSSDLAQYLLAEVTPPIEAARCLVVGDRMDTDVALAHAMGASSLLVLTGVSRAADAARAIAGLPRCPTAVASHLGALLELEGEAEGVAAGDGAP